ncbi:MAG: hypothetical protein ABIA75_08750 [Candidatus Neomarinimicrobiota bacterium]
MKIKMYQLILLAGVALSACGQPSSTNLDHALALVDSMTVDDTTLAYILIYADAPDYQPVVAQGEGITCVDDVGRFLEVLEFSILKDGRCDLIPVARGMTRFLLYMSRLDGLWYNFMEADGSVNRTHQNSIAQFGWWAIRGLRGLAAAYNILSETAPADPLLPLIEQRVKTVDGPIAGLLEKYPQYVDTPAGKKPAWMPAGAPDQTSELVLALAKLHRTGKFDYYQPIKQFSQALVATQLQQPGHDLNGMYFCWESIWHGWGNNQSLALLSAYKITAEPAFLGSVIIWADNFVPFIVEHQFPRRLVLNTDGSYDIIDYPQIAYGTNAVYQGIRTLANLTGSNVYQKQAEQVYAWFLGNNRLGTALYDLASGRCYDGINGPGSINLNSGAESTIECLLATQLRSAQ